METIEQPNRPIFREPGEIDQRLAALGLTVELLLDVVRQGEAARASATALDPTTTAGYLAWHRKVRALRERTLLLGWGRRDVKNCPLAVNPDARMAIVVATGNEATGTPGNPSNKFSKGPVLENAVDVNQLDLFAEPVRKKNECVTWFLLTRANAKEARSELSLPETMQNGYVVLWRERIILPVVTLDSTPAADRRDIDLAPDEIDVPVVRR